VTVCVGDDGERKGRVVTAFAGDDIPFFVIANERK